MALPAAAAAPAKKAAREFSFYLARFNYLLLTTDNQGYRLCLVQDSKEAEIMRTSFTGFQMRANEPEYVGYEWKPDCDFPERQEESIKLDLRHEKEPGERNNHDINCGLWKMTVTGQGTRFEQLKALLIQNRVEVFWDTKDALIFRGTTAAESWDDAFLRR